VVKLKRMVKRLLSPFNLLFAHSNVRRMVHSRTWDERIIKVSEEVRDALRTGRPVVALESTIISHGMPYPQNLETANRVESTVRENGAVPATISVLDGTICVGINSAELVRLA
jgi:pseudouridine-5'-phosphate glycosidase